MLVEDVMSQHQPHLRDQKKVPENDESMWKVDLWGLLALAAILLYVVLGYIGPQI